MIGRTERDTSRGGRIRRYVRLLLRLIAGAAGGAVVVLSLASPASAHHCGSLADCFDSGQALLIALAALLIIVGTVAIFVGGGVALPALAFVGGSGVSASAGAISVAAIGEAAVATGAAVTTGVLLAEAANNSPSGLVLKVQSVQGGPMTRYVALYCRLSPRPDGSYEGVEAQEKWGRDYAAKMWPDVSVKVFSDKGISAANGDHRPGFAELREAIRAGLVAQLWVVEQSRLERREVGWFELAAELATAGVDEVHTNRDGIVRVGDEIAGIKAVLNAAEVRKLTKRVRDTVAAKAANGEPAGVRPFGYRHARNADGVRTYEIIDEHAAVLREMAQRVLDGWSLAAIVRDLRERGFRGTTGGTIRNGAVKSMITNPAVAGKRTHHGQIIDGNWSAILDENTWQAVRAKLSKPRPVTRSDGLVQTIGTKVTRAGRKYLLTGGLAVCGVCDAPLAGIAKREYPKTKPSYVRPCLLCRKQLGGRSCVGIMLEPVEGHVLNKLWDKLDDPAFIAAVVGDDDHDERRREIVAQLDAVDRRRRELGTLWGSGTMPTVAWQAALEALDVTEHELRAELDAIPPKVDLDKIRTVHQSWDELSLDEQREFIRTWIQRVIIHRAKPGTAGFDSDRVVIEGPGW